MHHLVLYFSEGLISRSKTFLIFFNKAANENLKCLMTNRQGTCLTILCGLKVQTNQDQFQRIQKWHSVDLKLEERSYIDNNLLNRSIFWQQTYMLEKCD